MRLTCCLTFRRYSVGRGITNVVASGCSLRISVGYVDDLLSASSAGHRIRNRMALVPLAYLPHISHVGVAAFTIDTPRDTRV